MSVIEPVETDEAETPSLRASVREAVRSNPTVVVPFALLGLLVAGVDVVRQSDPVPTVSQTAAENGLLRLTLEPFPRAFDALGTTVGAVLGLEFRWLAATLLLESVVFVGGVIATVAAIWILRPAQSDPIGGFGRLFVYELGVVGVLLASDVGAARADLDIIGLVVFVVFVYLQVRWLAVPALLVQGTSLPTALRESGRRTWLSGWWRFGVLVAIGLGGSLLVSLPVLLPVALPVPLGSLLATTVVGTLHAVVVTVVV